MRILEELYFGNIKPNGKIPTNEDYQKEMATLSENEEKLFMLLDGKEKKLFFDYVNAWGMINATDTVENYIMGFKLGAKIILETIGNDIECIEEKL